MEVDSPDKVSLGDGRNWDENLCIMPSQCGLKCEVIFVTWLLTWLKPTEVGTKGRQMAPARRRSLQ